MKPQRPTAFTRAKQLALALVYPAILVQACSFGPEGDAMPDCSDSPLLADVREQGNLRLIVTLDVDVKPRGEATEEEIRDQQRRITEAQDRLIAELEGTETEVLRRYSVLPQLALRVDEAGLCLVLDSPLTRRVDPDVTRGPSDG